MGKSSARKSRQHRLLTYGIPLTAALIIASFALFGQLLGSPQPGQDFTVGISILYWQIRGNESFPHAIVPPAIGTVPGVWITHQYDFDGLNNRYPLYTDPPPANGNYSGITYIHVRSRSTHPYTLQNFFNVWGEPIGVNDTLGYTVPPPPGSNYFGSSWFWDMCVKPPGGVLEPPPKDWGSLVLVPGGMTILLYYSNVGCA